MTTVVVAAATTATAIITTTATTITTTTTTTTTNTTFCFYFVQFLRPTDQLISGICEAYFYRLEAITVVQQTE